MRTPFLGSPAKPCGDDGQRCDLVPLVEGIYQFTQNGLPPDCHAERSEASVTDSSLTLRMTVERSVIDEVAEAHAKE